MRFVLIIMAVLIIAAPAAACGDHGGGDNDGGGGATGTAGAPSGSTGQSAASGVDGGDVPNNYAYPVVDRCDALSEQEPDWYIFQWFPIFADKDGCQW